MPASHTCKAANSRIAQISLIFLYYREPKTVKENSLMKFPSFPCHWPLKGHVFHAPENAQGANYRMNLAFLTFRDLRVSIWVIPARGVETALGPGMNFAIKRDGGHAGPNLFWMAHTGLGGEGDARDQAFPRSGNALPAQTKTLHPQVDLAQWLRKTEVPAAIQHHLDGPPEANEVPRRNVKGPHTCSGS